jgi:tRNA U34 5-methylaminomethyl-2-thiouridine-forming methyltransferase MnmC
MHLVITGDGSHTLFVPELNEHYHSTFGALTESLVVFIRSGLDTFSPGKALTVFEIGFGTGLNALLTCVTAMEKKLKIQYYSLEKYPIPANLYTQLNYPLLMHAAGDTDGWLLAMHQAPWNENREITPGFSLHKINRSLSGFEPAFSCDLIYFDAFAPDKQPEMWSLEIFAQLYQCLNPEGLLTTYCVKGSVKRMLKSAGFTIEKLPGPPGKREILRGRKL